MIPLDLTIAIPVLNEETNLPGCLNCIGKDLAKKIVVIDSGSTDKTKEIAREFGTKILDFEWNGQFPKKRNWFLQNHCPNTKWILFLDADEYLTEGFKKELREKLSSEEKTAYWLKYSIWFMGKKLKGGYPLYKLALFKVGSGTYERIDEQRWSNLDMEIHEHPVINGSIGHFRNRIDHQDFRGISSYVSKHNEYATWEAQRYLASGKDAEIRSKWTWKQRLKYRLMRSIWIGPAFFLGSFVLLRGFLDGSRGLAFAIFKMSYFNQIYCSICEQKKVQNGGPGL
jgi:glycosyltransferase involved in cell wall biosynthesis